MRSSSNRRVFVGRPRHRRPLALSFLTKRSLWLTNFAVAKTSSGIWRPDCLKYSFNESTVATKSISVSVAPVTLEILCSISVFTSSDHATTFLPHGEIVCRRFNWACFKNSSSKIALGAPRAIAVIEKSSRVAWKNIWNVKYFKIKIISQIVKIGQFF